MQQAETLRSSSRPTRSIASSRALPARAFHDRAVAARAGLAIELCEDLVEHRLSSEPIAEWRGAVERAFEDASFRAPGGDSATETLARAWNGIRTALRADRRLPAVVAHGQLIALVLQSIDARFGYAGWSPSRIPTCISSRRSPTAA